MNHKQITSIMKKLYLTAIHIRVLGIVARTFFFPPEYGEETH